ncbi:MlaD family protein [Otariodibacter sp.]|uniref:MlaD family protein n=1 Tax=Otariodibacter sp. TaxID=3030919 RepID=UPI002610A3FC|nr:MlaD family protein [Otariodibacter sp.]
MTEQNSPLPAKVRQPRRISPFWILPLIAFIIGIVLFFQILKETGENITIRFQNGAGIEAGKTMIRYQGLQIGVVKKIAFVDDLKEIEVTAEINPEATSVLREGTKFWLVQPSASLAGISGIDALVSGNYITLLPGNGNNKYNFQAEDEPPLVPVTDGDLMVKLVADDLGSISIGANVYFRKVPVGTVADYHFISDQNKVEIDIVINKKYTHLVKKDSRFWNTSGIRADLNFPTGITIEVDSLMSFIQGSVAFDSPQNSDPAIQGEVYPLYSSLKTAKRGTEIKVTLPISANIQANKTALFYQGTQIGVLSEIESSSSSENLSTSSTLNGTLLIDPNYQDLLRSDSIILLKEPIFSLNKSQLTKFSELFRGNYFELIPGKSDEHSLNFNVQKESDYLLNRPNTEVFTLVAPQSYGVEQGQGIYYNDVQIGEILKRELTIENVNFSAIIFPEYRHLVGENSKFIAISNLDVSIGLDGMNINAGSPSNWLQGGIRLLEGKPTGQIKQKYPLYKNVESAISGLTDDKKQATITLSAKDLSGIDKGSVLLYRQFQVGEVLAIHPQKDKFKVDLFVQPQYQHLLSNTSRFWIEPAVKVDVSTSGLSLQTSPIMRTLKGAISFDNGGSKNNLTLYSDFEKAHSGNTYITIIAKDATNLSEGMPIKYMGLTIGTVEALKLDNTKKQIKLNAFIHSQYYNMVAKSGSKFKAISPEINTTGIKNLNALLQNYIEVEPGNGKYKAQFSLTGSSATSTTIHNGFPIIVETSDADGITPDAPVLYRGMQVGVVEKLTLSELADRVFIHLQINPSYRHLVRKNSQFWTSSGYSMSVGLNGATINSGTMSQLLNGGIAFSTPSGKIVQPQAEANRHFRLQRTAPNNALKWSQGIAE